MNEGWQVCVHANGDAAIDTTIDAFEAVLKAKPGPTIAIGSSTARSCMMIT